MMCRRSEDNVSCESKVVLVSEGLMYRGHSSKIGRRKNLN